MLPSAVRVSASMSIPQKARIFRRAFWQPACASETLFSDPALHAFAVTGESGISIWSEPGLSKASQYVVSDLVALARERPQLDTIEEANAMVVFPLPEAPVRITSD
jgi:hypothetical protein